jgi:hypothetical protein
MVLTEIGAKARLENLRECVDKVFSAIKNSDIPSVAVYPELFRAIDALPLPFVEHFFCVARAKNSHCYALVLEFGACAYELRLLRNFLEAVIDKS